MNDSKPIENRKYGFSVIILIISISDNPSFASMLSVPTTILASFSGRFAMYT